jgi:hypothetical protein
MRNLPLKRHAKLVGFDVLLSRAAIEALLNEIDAEGTQTDSARISDRNLLKNLEQLGELSSRALVERVANAMALRSLSDDGAYEGVATGLARLKALQIQR